MSLQNEIQSAIEAHAQWKINLLNAIDAGRSASVVPEVVAQDNACPFGQWLFGEDIPEKAKELEQYARCLSLHKEFHVLASTILLLAIEGKRLEALDALRDTGKYHALSSELIHLMQEWAAAFEKVDR